MFVGSCVVLISLVLGLMVGSIAGYYGGGIDRFVNVVVMNAFLSFPGNPDCHCLRGFSRPRNFQPRARSCRSADGSATRALVRGRFWRRANRICRSSASTRRERLAHHHAAYSAEYYSAGDCAVGDWHGGSNSRRSDDEFSWTRRSSTDSQLGIHAQRWPCAIYSTRLILYFFPRWQ